MSECKHLSYEKRTVIDRLMLCCSDCGKPVVNIIASLQAELEKERGQHKVDVDSLHGAVMQRTTELSEAREKLAQPHGGCPCIYEEPCSPRCTCRRPEQSGGCRRCARYGSLEQRQMAAKTLVERERKAELATAEAATARDALRTLQFRAKLMLATPIDLEHGLQEWSECAVIADQALASTPSLLRTKATALLDEMDACSGDCGKREKRIHNLRRDELRAALASTPLAEAMLRRLEAAETVVAVVEHEHDHIVLLEPVQTDCPLCLALADWRKEKEGYMVQAEPLFCKHERFVKGCCTECGIRWQRAIHLLQTHVRVLQEQICMYIDRGFVIGK